MTIEDKQKPSESYTIPTGAYMIGCPMLLTETDDKPVDNRLFEPGVGEIDGHKFFTVCTGGDGIFSLLDKEEDNKEVDAFCTDVATISVIPYELIPDVEAAEEYGRHFVVDPDDGSGEPDPGLEITVHYHTFDTGHSVVHHVDIEWYTLTVAQQYLEEESE